ncbi:MAG: glycyl radical protein [Cyclobacteriaceae bacterium]|nr:glycyl radical protein [Cyclobacteriaceae bacterium]
MINTATSLKISDRINTLREKTIRKKSTICTERAKFYTEIYKTHPDKPIILVRALALQKTVREMSIYIDEGELIVGNHSSALRAAPIFPEYAVGWIMKELDEFDKRPGDAFFLTDQNKEDLREICDWWKGKTLLEKGQEGMTSELREIHDSGIIRAEGNLTSGDGHIAVNFEKILELGLEGYLCEIKRWRKINAESAASGDFYEAMEMGVESFIHFIRRFEKLAHELSLKEENPARQAELLEIAGNCRHIANYPPDNFYRALQLVYFVQLVLQIESNGHSVSLGRVDQYLYRFYREDMLLGKISDAFVVQLLECTWIKLLSVNKIRSWSHTRYSAGGPLYQNVTIGGQHPDGTDAVNDLSYLILHSVGELRLTQPNLSVRFHKNISNDFLMACMDVIEKGFGMPAFNNDEIVIPSLIKLGVEPEDAYNYSAIGCIEIAVPGKWGYRCTGMSFLNFMRVFLAAINDGYDSYSKKTFFKGIGKLTDFTSFEQLKEAWKQQVELYTRAGIRMEHIIDKALEIHTPDILCSVFVDSCIERGLTIKEGGSKYDFVSGLQVGIANLGNALVAIKKLVFEEKRITAESLLYHLENDFEGKEGEKIRQLLLNFAPKYGNDNDEVDLLLHEAYMDYLNEIDHHRTTRHERGPIGCRYYGGTSSISANVPSGSVVPATPDGRKAFTPLAEGSSPTSGTDVLGPTAVFKSVSKLPTQKILGGVLLNQKLSPAAIAKKESKEKLVSIIRTFFTELKGWHVQYNILSRKTLEAAKENPEAYRDLVVRVAGYSAFFTNLSPEMQDDIIARTEHFL